MIFFFFFFYFFFFGLLGFFISYFFFFLARVRHPVIRQTFFRFLKMMGAALILKHSVAKLKKCHTINECLNINLGTIIYIHTCMHACIHTYIHTYIHTFIHTYIHTYILTHIHTYIHTKEKRSE